MENISRSCRFAGVSRRGEFRSGREGRRVPGVPEGVPGGVPGEVSGGVGEYQEECQDGRK